jgi:hypothetical protein
MKKFGLPVSACFLLACTLFFNCSRDNNLLETLETPGQAGEIALDLLKNSIKIWSGTSLSFSALSGGEFSIEASDTAIVDVKVDGHVFSVKAKAPGTTSITIKNEKGDEISLPFDSYAFSNNWVESQSIDLLYSNSINILAEDKTIAEIIREELAPLLASRERGYFFSENGELFVGKIGQKATDNGTFSWDEQARLLTLNFNGQVETYQYELKPVYPNLPTLLNGAAVGIPNDCLSFIVSIAQDFTGEYALKYPDAGITGVSVTRHIFSTNDFWEILKTSNPKKQEPIELDLRAYSIKIWSGTSLSFNALSEGEFSIEVCDTTRASATVEGNTFTVTAKKPGTTVLTITDQAGRITAFPFCSYTFFRNWSETTETDFLYKNSVNVVAGDNAVAEAIRVELAPVARQRNRRYYFGGYIGEYNHLSIGKSNGTFSWDESTRLLTMNINGQTEVYQYDLKPAYPNFFSHPNAAMAGITDRDLFFIVSITQDLTPEYIAKYPDAGITEVSITRHIRSGADVWQICKR